MIAANCYILRSNCLVHFLKLSHIQSSHLDFWSSNTSA